MAMDFPGSPNNGDSYNFVSITGSTITYEYNSTKGAWLVKSNGIQGPAGPAGANGPAGPSGSSLTIGFDNTTNASYYPSFFVGDGLRDSGFIDSDLTYNPSTGIMNVTSTASQYADLAEKYLADTEYEAGTVVSVGGSAEITATTLETSHSILGVVSDKPAYRMNEKLENGTYVALKGRVPVKVTGEVNKGDRLVASSIPGVAQAHDGIAGFAISLSTNEDGIVEAVIL